MESYHMIGLIIALIAVTGGLVIGVLAVWISIKTTSQEKITLLETRNKERLALIEKGMDPTLFDKKVEKSTFNGSLFWGLLLSGIALGKIIGYFLAHALGLSGEHILDNAMAILFGGLCLLIYYILQRKNEGKKSE